MTDSHNKLIIYTMIKMFTSDARFFYINLSVTLEKKLNSQMKYSFGEHLRHKIHEGVEKFSQCDRFFNLLNIFE